MTNFIARLIKRSNNYFRVRIETRTDEFSERRPTVQAARPCF
jgi:hypothetical protein